MIEDYIYILSVIPHEMKVLFCFTVSADELKVTDADVTRSNEIPTNIYVNAIFRLRQFVIFMSTFIHKIIVKT